MQSTRGGGAPNSMRNYLFSLAVIVMLVVSLVTMIRPAAAVSPPSLDGSAKNGCGYVTSCSVSLTTAHPSDVIIVGCDCWPSGAAFSVKDTAGLTFLPRTAQVGIGGGQFMETWYAISTTPLSSDVISVKTALAGETWYGVIAFAVSGGNIANPFVQGFPLSQANLNCAAPCNTGVSAPAGSFVFQMGGDTGSKVQTAGAGMTLIQASRSGQDAYAQYEVLSGSISAATLAFGTSQGSDFGLIVDAINPSTSSTSTSTSTSSTTLTTNTMTLDGSASTGCGYTLQCSLSLTTTQANDVIIVGCDCFPSSSSFLVKDTSGLTFNERESPLGIGGNQFIQTWYAVATSRLSSDTISVTTANSGETWYGVIAFAVSGANIAQPFATGSPLAQANLKCSSPCNTEVSLPAGVFVYQVGGDTGNTLQTAGTGMTLIQASRAEQDAYAQYEILSSSISGTTLSFGTTQGNDFGVIVDAIVPGTSTTSSTTSSSSSITTTSIANKMGLDGSAITYNNYDVASMTTNLVTAQPNDIIIVFVGIGTYPYGGGTSAPTVSSISANGLTFHLRQSSVVTPLVNGNHVDNEEWYAISSSPYSGPITVTATSEAGMMWLIAFGVYGANTQSPFDSNPGLPATQVGSDNNGATLSITTTTSDTFVFAYEDMPSAVGYPQIGAGFNQIASDFGATLHYGDPAAEYQLYTSPQTNLQMGFKNNYDAAGYVMIGDAIVQAT